MRWQKPQPAAGTANSKPTRTQEEQHARLADAQQGRERERVAHAARLKEVARR